MKFKQLNEEFTSDDLYKVLIDYVNDELTAAVDNIAIQASSDLEDYDAEYSAEEPTKYTDLAFKALKDAAEYFAMDMLYNAPEIIHEQLEADEEDGWGDQIQDALYDTFDDIDHVMYEIRMGRRGSYAGFGDKVDDLVDKLRELSTQLENDASYIEDQNAGQELQESKLIEDFDASKFIGKPLKDFLKTIDYASRISLDAETPYNSNDGGPGSTGGLNGRAHDVGWYLADKIVKNIEVPEDAKFFDYKILIESDNNSNQLTEKQWKHNLSVGRDLRKAIEDSDYESLKYLMKAAYKEIHSVTNSIEPDFFDEDDLEDKLEELAILDTEPNEAIDIDEEELEDIWNFELNDLYDLCDAANIWIPME